MSSIVSRRLASSLALALSLFVSLPLLTGCGKESPTAPHVAAAEPESLLVTVVLKRVDVPQDGDGIEGLGDFELRMTAEEVGGPGRLLVQRTPQIDSGTSYTVNQTLKVRIPKDRAITVGLTATEWDADILGRTYADSRMDHLTTSRAHSSTSTAAPVNGYEGFLKLGGGELEVRLVYSIGSVAI